MTNKIEVPRELLEMLVYLHGTDQYLDIDMAKISVLLAAPEAPRQSGCCCPPKGYTGIWAAAMCPVHHGFGAMIERQKTSGAPLSPDHSGGAGEVVLTAEENGLLKLIVAYPGSKLNGDEARDSEGNSMWGRLEALGLIECVGSYKWKPTFDAIDLGISAKVKELNQ